jgi:hypothetical protein
VVSPFAAAASAGAHPQGPTAGGTGAGGVTGAGAGNTAAAAAATAQPQASAARVGSGAPPTPRALPGNAVLGFFRNASGGLALTQTLQPRMSNSQIPGNQV